MKLLKSAASATTLFYLGNMLHVLGLSFDIFASLMQFLPWAVP
ncbi:hypothetical protein QO002_005706 [Pararhizobium capsulatum DSM 1112]|uniref:Uncharacterized protein n=1 Tax=Pararhizobium capsulatum DSM 1112 TaxID=1121113 RepID=A0ABU0BZ24_9HYPH|nr:hypothetical protein [Pararhizobium capsulatum]MDQ0323500.1 hypothetical protein [Pararhizobium capsulatum DSM 1112]